ncbi:MAG: hypothetical protein KJ583_04845 [Nanoarchaeota archaeon]|nr:hypothetical protein [Nanoarchaeota archaeon]MBU1270201.1 hypothetical protein [Nanoarchaeota archaeon]MBU1604617.1 hypothetical protein [Nanoarchaeota archaeon]MBU2443549.1 hypothetical protein [Nanoarchaeota archaeon]
MNILSHTIISAVIAMILWPFFGFWSLLVLVGGVLVDSDHLFWYVVTHRKFSIRKAYVYCMNIELEKNIPEYLSVVVIFHSYETVIALVLLATIIPQTIPLALGLVVHLLLDFVHIYSLYKKSYFLTLFKKSAVIFLYKTFFARK